MLEKILTDKFRKKLKLLFTDIKNQQDKRDQEEFAKDEQRIKTQLLSAVEPYPADVVLDEDFLVAAVDGSGTDNLMLLDDVRVHLFSTASVLVSTNTQAEQVFQPVRTDLIEQELGDQPHLDTHWHSGVRFDATKKLAETLAEVYPVKDMANLVLPFFQDHSNGSISCYSDFSGTEYERRISKLKDMESLISRERILTNPIVHEEIRKVSEYAAAHQILSSRFMPKYLLLDGAMSVFMHHVYKYPSMPSGFMLRELASLARKENVILCAVSKNHTIPFAHKIAKMARDVFGDGAKWFCHLPCRDDPGGGLHIYEDRTYIPPRLAVPYLFSFSRDNRPSRIDFDRVWWLKKIFVKDDPVATRNNEKALFRELEFMSRDARWYGYPVALALAHEQCKLGYEDLRLAREICRDVRIEMKLDSVKTEPYRADYNL
ncbi:MAG: hypothetical protein GF411_11815 [Candidatus Lokiarchaeota archaeon]|nr:hypothetical protein [Candidatus Lokiarchaeota archaeon]